MHEPTRYSAPGRPVTFTDDRNVDGVVESNVPGAPSSRMRVSGSPAAARDADARTVAHASTRPRPDVIEPPRPSRCGRRAAIVPEPASRAESRYFAAPWP